MNFFLDIVTNLIATGIWVVGAWCVLKFKQQKYEEIIDNAFKELKVNQPGWFDYLKRYGDLYNRINNQNGRSNSPNWTISDAIGALEMVREARVDIQKSIFTRIFYNHKVAELEAIERAIIDYLNGQRINIQNANI